VNVHPRKMEVRFANEQGIFSAFYRAIQNKLESVSLVKNTDFISPFQGEYPKGEGL